MASERQKAGGMKIFVKGSGFAERKADWREVDISNNLFEWELHIFGVIEGEKEAKVDGRWESRYDPIMFWYLALH